MIACKCGCGRTFEPRTPSHKLHADCRKKRLAESKAISNRERRALDRAVLSVARATVGKITRDHSPLRKPQPLECDTCCDLPFRRERPRCKDCGRYYQPEPVERVQGTIRSSAGMLGGD